MINCTALNFEDDSIRTSESGQVSVYDFIRVVGGSKNPSQTLKRIQTAYPEVIPLCYDWKFPGSRQRDTPVSDKEGILKILNVLPGVAGARYREEAARIVLAFLEAPADLAIAAISRTDSELDLKRIKARLDAKISNKTLNASIQSAGGSCFAAVANINNIAVLGCTAKEIQILRGVKKTRDGLTTAELSALNLTEIYEQQAIERGSVRGDFQIVTKCRSIADIMASAQKSILALV